MRANRSTVRLHATHALIAVCVLALVGCDSGSKAPSAPGESSTPTTGPASVASAKGPSRADVVSIGVQIFPEGTVPGPVTPASPNWSKILALLPAELPAVHPQTDGCTQGNWSLIALLRDGTALIYGPCSMPPDLSAAAAAFFTLEAGATPTTTTTTPTPTPTTTSGGPTDSVRYPAG